MARLSDLTVDQMSPEQERVHDRLASGPRQNVRGPFPAWLHALGLADRAEALGRYCRFENGLGPRVNEITVLTTAARWRAAFVFRNHVGLALSAGRENSVVEAIRLGHKPDLTDPAEAAAHDLLRELLETGFVGQPRWERATEALGEAGVVNLIGISGYYGLVCMTTNAAEVGEEADRTAFATIDAPATPSPEVCRPGIGDRRDGLEAILTGPRSQRRRTILGVMPRRWATSVVAGSRGTEVFRLGDTLSGPAAFAFAWPVLDGVLAPPLVLGAAAVHDPSAGAILDPACVVPPADAPRPNRPSEGSDGEARRLVAAATAVEPSMTSRADEDRSRRRPNGGDRRRGFPRLRFAPAAGSPSGLRRTPRSTGNGLGCSKHAPVPNGPTKR